MAETLEPSQGEDPSHKRQRDWALHEFAHQLKAGFASQALPTGRSHIPKDKSSRSGLLPSPPCGIYRRPWGAARPPPSPARLFSAHTPRGAE